MGEQKSRVALLAWAGRAATLFSYSTPHSSLQRGVTLTELIIAMSLLAILAAALFGAYVIGTQTGQSAQRLAVAAGLAQASLEPVIGTPSAIAVPEQGQTSQANVVPGFNRTVRVEPVAPGLSQVIVTVTWEWRGRKQRLTVTDLIRTRTGP